MAQPELTPQLALLEEAMTVLFCQIDDAYYRLNPKGRSYETLKELSDSEVITLALFQQLRGVESERSFLREAARFFSHLFPGVVGFWPSSIPPPREVNQHLTSEVSVVTGGIRHRPYVGGVAVLAASPQTTDPFPGRSPDP